MCPMCTTNVLANAVLIAGGVASTGGLAAAALNAARRLLGGAPAASDGRSPRDSGEELVDHEAHALAARMDVVVE